MFDSLIIFLIVAFLGFSLVGFVAFIKWTIKSIAKKIASLDPEAPLVSTSSPDNAHPQLQADVIGARRLLEYLLHTEQLTPSAYHRLRSYLEETFPETLKTVDFPVSDLSPADDEIILGEVIEAEPVFDSPPAANEASQSDQPNVLPTDVESQADQRQLGPVAPARSFAEIMSGFMQEKNMRWGELMSGILIIMSVIGLVISLRKQLNDSIPYFPSLLFMLMTGAIIGAGIYTLKKWKLRNTSRGALVIGLLLIPLNFVAACVLSSGAARRPLQDPWLWAAIVIGFVSFTTMAWYGAKHLLRKNYWPIVVALVGSGAGAILIDRTQLDWRSSFHALAASFPIVTMFLIGIGFVRSHPATRRHWSQRSQTRLFLHFGITTFAAVASLMLLLIRSDAKPFTAIAMTPWLILISLGSTWVGAILQPAETEDNQETAIDLRALSLQILGMVLAAIFLAMSVANPTLFVINCGVIGVGLGFIAYRLGRPQFLPPVWAVLAAGGMVGQALLTRQIAWDCWTSLDQFAPVIVSGKSGLVLLVAGAMAAGMQTLLAKQVADQQTRQSMLRSGQITGGAIFLTGAIVALIASLLHRDHPFDNHVASALLILGGIGGLLVVLRSNRTRNRLDPILTATEPLPKRSIRAAIWAHGSAILLAAGVAHALLWNRLLGNVFGQMIGLENGNLVGVLAILGIVFATVTASLRPGSDRPIFRAWAIGTSTLALIGSVFFIPYQTGFATGVSVVATVAWWLIARAKTAKEKTNLIPWASGDLPFVIVTGIGLAIGLAELGPRVGLFPRYDHPRHALVQAIGLSIWAIGWTVLAHCLEQRPVPRMEVGLFTGGLRTRHLSSFLSAALGIAMVGAGGIIVTDLVFGAMTELFQGFSTGPLLLSGETGWCAAALGMLALAILFLTFQRPRLALGSMLVVLWLLGWATGAYPFEDSRSIASAVRWLLSIGALVGAGLVFSRRPLFPFWVRTRRRLGFSGRSTWGNSTTRRLLRLALGITVPIVLLLTTITLSQILLHGPGSLGGPAPGSWFDRMTDVIWFGVPITLLVTTFLVLAISERRPRLAMAGSFVFQYIILLAIVLFFLSSDHGMESYWLIAVLQSVSIGMTVYGFGWWAMRHRIERMETGLETGTPIHQPLNAPVRRVWPRPLELHTGLNGVWVTALVLLVLAYYLLNPTRSGGWINSVGSPLGMAGSLLFALLVLLVWRRHLLKSDSLPNWLLLGGWAGIVAVGLAAAFTDAFLVQRGDDTAWIAFRIIAGGSTLVVAGQVLGLWIARSIARRPSRQSASTPFLADRHDAYETHEMQEKRTLPIPQKHESGYPFLPLFLTSAIALTFSFNGATANNDSFWFFWMLIVAVSLLLLTAGMVLRQALPVFVASAVALVGTVTLATESELPLFREDEPTLINLSVLVLILFGIINLSVYRFHRSRGEAPMARSFVRFPNLIVLLGSLWVLVAAVSEFSSLLRFHESPLINRTGVMMLIALGGLLGVSLVWNDRRRFWIAGAFFASLGTVISLASVIAPPQRFPVSGLLASALTVMAWGIIWANREKMLGRLRQWHVPRVAALERSARWQLPWYLLGLTGMLVLLSFLGVSFGSFSQGRPIRLLYAATPLLTAVGIGALSDPKRRRWLQRIALGLITVSGLLAAWTDLPPAPEGGPISLAGMIRSLIVLTGMMFVFGGLIPRWVRSDNGWLPSLRAMAGRVGILAMICLGVVLFQEQISFHPDQGCGLSTGEAGAVALALVGMIVGLISIAVRPQNDPFSLIHQGRQLYAYAAQFVLVGLVMHLYFSMPFLFKLGIIDYWPYLVMAVSFGGAGLAHWLRKRKLDVLGQPLLMTSAFLPLATTFAMLAIDSAAEGAMVMLVIGLAYLMISYLHQSILSGVASILFGNLALWMYYGDFLHFSFFDHPQLWLIPPAISVLIAGQLNRHRMSTSQLALLRYLCVAVIYISSTSEIFIAGLGDALWPPVILALLSVGGVMTGMLLHIRSFLYLGSLFLMTAMIVMVAHAQQRIGHVWPWWAFGITLGIGILILFGLFEKKKNQMKQIAQQMKTWEP